MNHIGLFFFAKIKFFIGTEADDDKDGWSCSTKEPYQLK